MPISILEKHLQLLNDVRFGNTPITDFHFQHSEDENICDNNRRKRFNLITALMYDPLPTDEPLLRELFLHEIIRAEKDAFQGIGDAMFRVAALLARFKNPENVWLFTRAKQANFDTGCGFDYEFLVSAGIDVTYDQVDGSESDWKEVFYNVVGESREQCHISTDELNDFEQHLGVILETDLDTIEDEIELAIELGEMEIVRERVNQWKTDKQDWTAADADSLIYYENLLGNTEGKIAAYELALTLESRDRLKESILEKLCELYLKADTPFIAWERMQSRLATAQSDHWLPGNVVTLLFEIVCAFDSPQHPVAAEAFARGMHEILLLPSGQCGFKLGETAERATVMMGDKVALEKVRKIFT